MSENATDVTTPPSDAPEERASGEAPIGFDRAEYDAAPASGPMACSLCRSAIEGRHHSVNSRMICVRCAEALERDLAYARSRGALWRSIAWGMLAAVAGAIVWMMIDKATGYELGLVAVGVGFVVGKAVRRGSRGVGGRRFQVIAVSLTFFAITVAHVPAVLRGLAASERAHASAPVSGTQSEDGPRAQTAAPASADTPAERQPPVSLGKFLLAVSILLVIAAIAPLLGLPQTAMGVVIIGIALYEAWKFTRAVPITIAGPFDAAPPAEPATLG